MIECTLVKTIVRPTLNPVEKVRVALLVTSLGFASISTTVLSQSPPTGVTEADSPSSSPSQTSQATGIDWLHPHKAAMEDASFIPGKGLRLKSRDDLFSIELRLRAQFRADLSRSYDVSEKQYQDPQLAMMIRRARVQFGGNIWSKTTKYKAELAVSPRDLGMTGSDTPPIVNKDQRVSRSPLLDWYIQFGQNRDLNLRLGQYKVPYSRERVISSGNLQFVDRTILNSEFTVDRDIGFDIRSKDLFGLDKRLRYAVGIYAGEGHSSYQSSDLTLMSLARIEFLPFGNFKDYQQADLYRRASSGLSLGAGFATIQRAKGSRGILGSPFADGGTTDYENLTIDASFKSKGLSVETVYFSRTGSRSSGDATDANGDLIAIVPARNGWGAGTQAGYLFANNTELAFRYSAIYGSKGSSSMGDSKEAGLAFNYYMAGHPYKWQADYIHYWGEASKGAGDEFAKGKQQLRVQLQAAF